MPYMEERAGWRFVRRLHELLFSGVTTGNCEIYIKMLFPSILWATEEYCWVCRVLIPELRADACSGPHWHQGS